MIGLSISPRDRRTLLIGLATIGGLVASFRGVPLWRAWQAGQRSAAADAIARAGRIESTVSSFSASLDTLEARTARLTKGGSAFLIGDTLPAAAGMLAGILAEAARSSLVRINTLHTSMPQSQGAQIPRVMVDLEATADIAGLAMLLRQLEGGPVILAIRRLSVRPQSVEGLPSSTELLSVRLTVEALAMVLRRVDP